MTNTKNKEEWLKTWMDEANNLYRVYQCNANKEIYDSLYKSIADLKEVIKDIANEMEKEGTWKKVIVITGKSGQGMSYEAIKLVKIIGVDGNE